VIPVDNSLRCGSNHAVCTHPNMAIVTIFFLHKEASKEISIYRLQKSARNLFTIRAVLKVLLSRVNKSVRVHKKVQGNAINN
jgi:hypothetical protein